MQTAKSECKKVLNDLLKIMDEKDVHNIIFILQSIKRDEEKRYTKPIKKKSVQKNVTDRLQKKKHNGTIVPPTSFDFGLNLYGKEYRKRLDEITENMNKKWSYIEDVIFSFYPAKKETRTQPTRKTKLKVLVGGKAGEDHAADRITERSTTI